MLRIGTVAGLALMCQALNWAQTTAPQGIRAQIIVTVGHLYGHEPPVLTRDDILVAQPIDPLPIINLIPLRGERAGLELFLLVDRCSDCEPNSKIDELRRFIEAQPSTTAVGVAYIKDGNLQIAENPTRSAPASPSTRFITRALITFQATGSNFMRVRFQLAHVAQETGGEAFFWTFAPQPSIAPYLADIATHLANQYLLEFLANPAEGSGALTDVIVTSKIGYVDLMAPYKVWVPGRRSGSTGASRGKQ